MVHALHDGAVWTGPRQLTATCEGARVSVSVGVLETATASVVESIVHASVNVWCPGTCGVIGVGHERAGVVVPHWHGHALRWAEATTSSTSGHSNSYAQAYGREWSVGLVVFVLWFRCILRI